jgi:N-acetylglucosaminyldiphosphoundecaprenol N-acetyl-beta-D-mannosaminyltransferase
MRTDFLGVALDILPLAEVENAVSRAVSSRKGLVHCSLNALKVVEASRDHGIKKLLASFDLITADGMSVVWGLRLLGQGKVEQVAGVELMTRLLRLGATRHWRFYLLGTEPDVANVLQQRVESSFSGVRIAGVQHGYFSKEEEPTVVDRIRNSGADILFVGMPSPKKEYFLLNHRDNIGVPFAMGVGGGLDILAGKTRRAPVWMQRAGLEWSFRVIQEPRRLARRYVTTNFLFARMLAEEMITGHRSRKAPSC